MQNGLVFPEIPNVRDPRRLTPSDAQTQSCRTKSQTQRRTQGFSFKHGREVRTSQRFGGGAAVRTGSFLSFRSSECGMWDLLTASTT